MFSCFCTQQHATLKTRSGADIQKTNKQTKQIWNATIREIRSSFNTKDSIGTRGISVRLKTAEATPWLNLAPAADGAHFIKKFSYTKNITKQNHFCASAASLTEKKIKEKKDSHLIFFQSQAFQKMHAALAKQSISWRMPGNVLKEPLFSRPRF